MRLAVCLAFTLALASVASAAVDTSPAEGLRDNTPSDYALVGARIVTSPGRVIERGAVVIRDGRIAMVTEQLTAADGVRRVDVSGKVIYPGFIDSYTEVDIEGDPPAPGYWNDQITPQRAAAAAYAPDESLHRALRRQGFAARVAAPSGGVIQGQSAVVLTSDGPASATLVKESAALHMQLTRPYRARRSRDAYPTSPMGVVALARQAMYDASWLRQATAAVRADASVERPEANLALSTLTGYLDGGGLVVISAPNELFAIRADDFAREFVLRAALLGSGNEYRRLEAIRKTGRPVIVPLDFPRPPDVASPERADAASLEDLMHWRLAPENAGRLAAAGVEIALTTDGLRDRGEFLANLRKAVDRGLDPDAALAALTITPARLFGLDKRMGEIAPGMMANLVVADGDLFDKETKLVATWVDGQEFKHEEAPIASFLGDWDLEASDDVGDAREFTLSVTGSDRRPRATLKPPASDDQAHANEREESLATSDDADAPEHSEQAPADEESPDDDEEDEPSPSRNSRGVRAKPLSQAGYQLSGALAGEKLGVDGKLTFTLTIVPDDERPRLAGVFRMPDGRRVTISGEKATPETEDSETPKPSEDEPSESRDGDEADDEPSEDADDPEPERLALDVNYPLGAFGFTAAPEQATVALTGATVWTCGPEGTIEDATVLVRDGRIEDVGAEVSIPADARVIDCQGKHLTPGIIDCHSHIATDGGINESGQAITAEVRISDFIDPDDISIYRQLAGGVTTVNVLHGSANPIGGQNQVIKLRWGAGPDEMCFEGAPPGIKFALGENVKQSNWGDRYGSRYPQTRMGVDELMVDEFRAAQDYRDRRRQWEQDRTGLPPRRDLELDAIVEVLEQERWIHCHSYRQSEILALLRTLEAFDVQIGTLQHILEGYKVAPEMAEHGAMGSSFSDWWAYKFEVYDAIPHNGALMHRAGVVVSFNSDDAELGRRLNLEAAKATKYGGVPPEEAIKFVTLNPAKQLRIDQRVGSVEPGKDADLVVWSGPPMSTYSRCEQTWLDGRKYFDFEADRRMRERDGRTRSRLVATVLDSDETAAGPGDNRVDPSSLWPRHDEFCTGHVHGHQHGH